MPSFQVNDDSGYALNYEVIPHVLPVTTLFIHGNVASTRWWYPTRDVWKSKATGQNMPGSMILVDYRGCGSTPAPREQDIKMDVFAQDFISLSESLNLGPIHLVGHSAGGLIAALMSILAIVCYFTTCRY